MAPLTAPIPAALRDRIRALITSDGERLARARLGIPRHTLARALAGLTVRAGTHALIRQRLDAIEATDGR
jgi:hypothetical protein